MNNNYEINHKVMTKVTKLTIVITKVAKSILILITQTASHKTNDNYGNLMYDKVEKRVTKNLLCDSCLTLELG